MIIRHFIKEQHSSYTRLDRYVFVKKDLSDGAKVLYGYLAGLRPGANFSDNYIIKVLGISKAVLYRRKKELIDFGLILIDKIDMRTHAIYIGTTKVTAQGVKTRWMKEEDDTIIEGKK